MSRIFWTIIATVGGLLIVSESIGTEKPVRVHVQGASKPYSLLRAGQSERFEVRAGDHWPLDVRNDGGQTERERSEIAGAPLVPGAAMSARFDFLLPPGPPTRARWTILAQVHHVDFPEQQTYTVPLLLGLEAGDRLFVRATVNPENSLASFRDVVLWHSKRPFTRGRVHRVAIVTLMDVKASGEGSLDVWFDGRQVARYRGPIGIAGAPGYYWKHGIYRSAAAETTAVTFRNLCFGGSECKRSKN